MSRRLRTKAVKELLKLMENALKIATSLPPEPEPAMVIDAKPLPIGSYSKDPDAKWGRSAGGLAKGYKLYAVWGSAAVPEALRTAAVRLGQGTVASSTRVAALAEAVLRGMCRTKLKVMAATPSLRRSAMRTVAGE